VSVSATFLKTSSFFCRTYDLYAGESDWVFASFKLRRKQPREGNMIGADYLRPAAVRAGVLDEGDKRRFGWHNFRHSLASFLVASGTDTKTVQELLRHTKVQTTLDLYSQSMSAEWWRKEAC
jgi:integrase